MSQHFIIFDLEYTTWEGAKKNGWMADGQYREIVQIGALKIDTATLSVIEELNLLVKPKINPALSLFFCDLTKITQDDVDRHGIDFITAWNRFNEFCGEKASVFSYGNDMFVLGENVALNHAHPRLAIHPREVAFINITPYIHRFAPGIEDYVSGQLWQYFNLPKPHEADEHNALFDCYSILAAIRHLTAQGKRLPL